MGCDLSVSLASLPTPAMVDPFIDVAHCIDADSDTHTRMRMWINAIYMLYMCTLIKSASNGAKQPWRMHCSSVERETSNEPQGTCNVAQVENLQPPLVYLCMSCCGTPQPPPPLPTLISFSLSHQLCYQASVSVLSTCIESYWPIK